VGASDQWFTGKVRCLGWGRGASCTTPVDLITIPFTMKLVTMVVVAIVATAQAKVRLRPCILDPLSGSLHELDTASSYACTEIAPSPSLTHMQTCTSDQCMARVLRYSLCGCQFHKLCTSSYCLFVATTFSRVGELAKLTLSEFSTMQHLAPCTATPRTPLLLHHALF
jgi:hypothetical protein